MKLSSTLKRAPFASGIVVLGLLTAAATWTRAQTNVAGTGSTVTLAIDSKAGGPPISPDFIGLSFETEKILAETNGSHYFSATNKALIATFKALGIKNLRIGGNTADRPTVKLPTETDVDDLFGFARAAGVKVIYTLRLKQGDPQAAAQMARYIQDRYRSELLCFAIGNEPSAFGRQYTYSLYRDDWKKFMGAILAAVPEAKFCGANVHEKPEWARQFAADFGPSGHVALITEHFYPGGSAYTRTNAAAALADDATPTRSTSVFKDATMGRDQMLSGVWFQSYQKLYDGFGPFVRSSGLPYRLEEANNFFHGGLLGASDSFASALWGLEFMYWWASHDCDGINFHTGDVVAAGGRNTACRYAAFWTVKGGYDVHPIGYALKAFDLGSHGRFVAARLTNETAALALSAYAVLGDEDNCLYVTLINKERGAAARDATVTLKAGRAYRRGQAISLLAPKGDLSATSGVTLGGGEIRKNGTWNGKWTALPAPSTNGEFKIKLPAGTALLVKLAEAANYDEKRVGTFTLPDPLRLRNGKPVRDAETWVQQRRPEILKLYQDKIYGHSPEPPGDMRFDVVDEDRQALGGKAVRKQIVVSFGNADRPKLNVLLYTPANAAGPVPVFLCLSFSANHKITTDPGVRINEVWDRRKDTRSLPPADDARGTSHSWKIEETLARGYGVAAVNYCDIEPDLDDGTGVQYGVRSLFFKPGQTNTVGRDAWGAIGAWAWGASRVLDYLETDKDVDGRRVIMTGQSRLGKTALWAGAQDPRFAIVIASCSGEMGAALARRDYGETVTSMAKSYAYQFCRNFLSYSNRIGRMPVDSHLLVSLIAPRPLYLSTGSLDRWSDPHGEFEAAIAAGPVYGLFGKQGIVTNLPSLPPGGGSGSVLKSAVLNTFPMPPLDVPVMRDIGFQTHTGQHDILPPDWDRFLDFADLHLKGAK